MWTEDQGRIEDDFREWEGIRIFHAKILFRELARKFDQDPMGIALRVPKQGHNDMTVAEV